MKAQVLCDIGDLRYEDVAEPKAESGEVVIAVKATGICGSDVPRIYQTGAHRMPLIPGHEFSGIVERVGAGVDKSWSGKRVGLFPLIPCGKCPQCEDGHYELCRNYDYIGSRRDGAFAECVAVPAANLVELPDDVSFETAAMLEPMAVAAHAMRRAFETAGVSDDRWSDLAARQQASDNLLPNLRDKASAIAENLSAAVCGLGTIGLLLAMFLRDAGIQNLYLIGNKESQRARAERIGIPSEHFCDSKKEDVTSWLREKADGGVDLVFECVGGQDVYQMAVDIAAPMGVVVLVGNPHGDMMLSRDIYWKILRNQLTLTGTWNSSFVFFKTGKWRDDWNYVLSRVRNKEVTPEKLITHRFSLDRLKEGLEVMRDKTEDYCKIMITPLQRLKEEKA